MHFTTTISFVLLQDFTMMVTNLNKYSVRKSHALNFVLLLYSGKTGGNIIKMHCIYAFNDN